MYLTAIIGDPGSGKTSLLTAVLHDYGLLGGFPVIANYRLEFPSVYMPFDQFALLPESIKGAYIGMDELGVGADSYEFMASGPRKITRLSAQARKRECRIYYTAQRFGMVTKRLRDLTDGFILMEDLDKGKPGHTLETCNALFRATFLDSMERIMRRVIFSGKPYQHLYNTREIIDGYTEKESNEDDE